MLKWVPEEKNENLEEDEFEYYCFPEQEYFERVKNTNGGRVFTFHSKMNEERYFFWMQHPDDSNDQEFIEKVNDKINQEESN